MLFDPPHISRKSLTKDRIESELAGYFGRRFCCLTNRGTTALTAALAALDLPPDTKAVFPAVMCSVPVFSARFAGWQPEFADVNLDDANFDLDHLERVLSAHRGKVGAVVPVHMFGRTDDLDRLRSLCEKYGAALVEDVALSMGARYRGKRAGGFGTLACLSFVRKMLPLEMGGAVLTDDPVLDGRARKFVEGLPPPPPDARERVRTAMKAFHALTGQVAGEGWKQTRLLRPFEEKFRRLLLARTTDDDWKDSIVLEELKTLEDVGQARRARAEVYETVLSHPRLRPLNHTESCFFAYPVRLLGVSAESFLHFAEERGFTFKRIAYPDIHLVFCAEKPGSNDRPDSSFPNALLLEKELLGFPVDDNQPVSAFWEYAEDFARLLREYLEKEPDLPPFPWRGKLELRLG